MLVFSDYPKHVQAIVDAAIAAADPQGLVQRSLRITDGLLEVEGRSHPIDGGGVYLVAIGKAAGAMANAALETIGSQLKEGVIVSKVATPTQPVGAMRRSKLRYFQAGHPIPDEESVAAGAAIGAMMGNATSKDIVLCLISGGASALVCQPSVDIGTWQALNQALLRAGCPIGEVNTVRQWFDQIKGGGLLAQAAPAPVISLILSDVIGNRLEHIGSGPTVLVNRSRAAVTEIMQEYDVWSQMTARDARVLRVALENKPALGVEPAPVPTPTNLVIGDVRLAAEAAAVAAAQLGFSANVVACTVEGEAREIGREAALLARGEVSHLLLPANGVSIAAMRKPACIIFGGETTVTVTGSGTGGRNQELALAAAVTLSGTPDVIVASFATDGEDGVMPVAGAMASGSTVDEALACGLDAKAYLEDNNSYQFFAKLGTGHLTANRGTNVNDILLVLRY